MRAKIQNIDDLRAEIQRLSLVRVEMETDLKIEAEKIKMPFLFCDTF